MRKAFLVGLGVAGLGVTCLAGTAQAQIMAKVGGVPITMQQVEAANPGAATNRQIRQKTLIALINRQALLNEARKEGIEKSKAFQNVLNEARENLEIQLFAKRYFASHPIPEAKIKAEYDKLTKVKPPQEYRLREIVLPNFSAAKSVMADLKSGKNFSMLAAEKSTDKVTAYIGGELGWQLATSLQAPVLKTLKSMKPGQVAGPVSLPHDFVVLQLLGKRETPKPAFDTVRKQIENGLRQREWIKHIIKIRTQQKAHLVVPLTGK
jgi:peptidyl-prolyl cis-trans isomerase C